MARRKVTLPFPFTKGDVVVSKDGRNVPPVGGNFPPIDGEEEVFISGVERDGESFKLKFKAKEGLFNAARFQLLGL